MESRAHSDPRSSVLVASTDEALDPAWMEIHRRKTHRVVMSLGGESGFSQMPSLEPGDSVAASAELEITLDGNTEKTAWKTAYDYPPHVEAELLLAASADEVKERRGRAISIGAVGPITCEPHRKHHFLICIEPERRWPVPKRGVPWKGTSYLNLVLTVHHRRAQDGNVLFIGQNETADDGKPAPPKGGMARLNVARFRGPPAERQERTATGVHTTALPVAKKPKVVRSFQLTHLKAHEQLLLKAELHARNPHGYAARISTKVILADHPNDVEPSKRAKKIAPFEGEVGVYNGTNCLPNDGVVIKKVGAARIHDRAGRKLYVNHVAVSSDPEGTPGIGDAVAIDDAGSLTIERFAADLIP